MPEGIKYHIIRADKEGCPALPNLEFTDPAEAALVARKLSREMGEKLTVKIAINDKWKKREQGRFDDGTYKQLPWAHLDFWTCGPSVAIHKDHFAHPSMERPGYIAYTKDAEDGMKDKQTMVRPGAYLKKYFARSMDRYGFNERQLVNYFNETYGPCDVKFATTEDEIISVYENGPDTCMKGRQWPSFDGRDSGPNPAHIYAYGDLQVAYLGELDDASARALVWPEKKIYSRVYGDIATLTRGLERLGYKWGAPIGAKLKRIEMRKVKFDPNYGYPTGCFIAPYLDKKNQRGGGHLSVLDKGTHLEICEEGIPGSHHCGLADGYSGQYVPREDEMPTFTCDNCGTAGHQRLQTVYTDREANEEASWCKRCQGRFAFRCGYSDVYFSVGEVERVIVGDNYWNEYYADMYAVRCEMSGRLVNEGDVVKLHFPDGTCKQVWSEWAENEGGYFRSGVTGRNYLKRHRIVMNGYDRGMAYIAKHELTHHGFVCSECGNAWNINDRVQSDNDDKLCCPDCAQRKLFPTKKAALNPYKFGIDEAAVN